MPDGMVGKVVYVASVFLAAWLLTRPMIGFDWLMVALAAVISVRVCCIIHRSRTSMERPIRRDGDGDNP